ncbi:MAG: hypothetical protein GX853_09425 [Chloroflexi bacterium]|nr:hypothetical protein [Chloroflexota bacterium]
MVHYWGSSGEAPGQFSHPNGITIDDDGNVYVVDEHNHRIQKFDKHGNFLLTWGTHGYSEGHELHLPKNIAVNGDGDIVVTDAHIRVFSTDGVFIRFILTPPERPIPNFTALSYDNEGKLFICNSRLFYHGIDMFNKNDQLLRSWGYNTTDPGRLDWTRSVTTSRDGNILVSDAGDNRIQVFSSEGLYLQSFGERSPDNNTPMDVTALAISNLDDIYVADNSSRIHVYSKDFVHKFSFGSEGDNDGQWRAPIDIAIDKTDNVYVVEGHANYKVHKFTPFGQFIKSWRITKVLHGCSPGSIATYNDEIFVACEKIEVFDLDGNFLRSFLNDREIVFPIGLEIDSNGRLYVSSRQTEEIFILNKNGEILSQFGGRGSQIGQFSYANDIRYHDNNLIIADSGNFRIQVFSLGTPPPDGYSGLAQNGSFEATPEISEWITGGNFPVALSNNASHGQKALVLGHIAPGRTPQEQGKAFAYSNFYVDPNWTRPVLSFDYNMFANDVKAWSDFFVEVQDGVGLNHLATVVQDGFEPCIEGAAPNPGQNLGWRSVEFDLSAFKGQHIRLKFTVQNKWPNAWGMWTHVDNVRVLDYGAALLPPGPFNINLPFVSTYHCDPIGKSNPVYRGLPFVD